MQQIDLIPSVLPESFAGTKTVSVTFGELITSQIVSISTVASARAD